MEINILVALWFWKCMGAADWFVYKVPIKSLATLIH